MPVTLPTSWTDQGMDWSDPDPFNAVYWRALMVALGERLAVTGFFNDYGNPDGMSTLLFGDSFLTHPDSSLNTSGIWLIEGWLWQATADSQWIDVSADLTGTVPTYRLPSGYIGQIYAEAGRYYVTPDDILIPELLPWVTPVQLKGEFTLALAKRYLKQRKSFIDHLVYAIKSATAAKRWAKQGASFYFETLEIGKAEAEAAYDADATAVNTDSEYPTSTRSLSTFYKTGTEFYVAGLGKDVQRIRLNLAFPYACDVDFWVSFGLPSSVSPEIHIEFNASAITTLTPITAPGTYKIATKTHSAGASCEWFDLGDDLLSTHPAWPTGPFADDIQIIRCGCVTGSPFGTGFFILKFNIAGGFAFRPST